MTIDIALGRSCHFCGDRDARNCRVRREGGGAPAEELTVPLCGRHRLLLQAGGLRGRLHKPTGVRWWYAGGEGAPPADPSARAGCPADALLGQGASEPGERVQGAARAPGRNARRPA